MQHSLRKIPCSNPKLLIMIIVDYDKRGAWGHLRQGHRTGTDEGAMLPSRMKWMTTATMLTSPPLPHCWYSPSHKICLYAYNYVLFYFYVFPFEFFASIFIHGSFLVKPGPGQPV
jgi:hypothetical protein